MNAVGGKKDNDENGWGETGGRGSSPSKEEERRARSPGKEVDIVGWRTMYMNRAYKN